MLVSECSVRPCGVHKFIRSGRAPCLSSLVTVGTYSESPQSPASRGDLGWPAWCPKQLEPGPGSARARDVMLDCRVGVLGQPKPATAWLRTDVMLPANKPMDVLCLALPHQDCSYLSVAAFQLWFSVNVISGPLTYCFSKVIGWEQVSRSVPATKAVMNIDSVLNKIL